MIDREIVEAKRIERVMGMTMTQKILAAHAGVEKVSAEELAKRKAEMPLKKKEVSGYLKRYASQVSSADKGAIINK
jgi:dihydroxyacid dehydratase/phosphogluconate dehydratase